MPRFEPFRGLRYDADIDLDAVTAPPYDVIDADERAALAGRAPCNAVHIDLPSDDDGVDRYQRAAELLQQYRDQRILRQDPEPSLYLYRMEHHDDDGRARSTLGVIGALGIEAPGAGDVLPHEHTTPKARSDRLELLRATDANLSPIWCLSLAGGLSALCEPDGEPDGVCIDDQGVRHLLWRVDDPEQVAAIAARVASAPLVIADGHHRYETALQYRDERRSSGGAAGGHDLVMSLVVELTDSQLTVRPIHRLLYGLAGVDLLSALEPHFEVLPGGPADTGLPGRMHEAGALALVQADGGAWLLRPRPGRFPDDMPDLDSSRLDVARETLPPHELTFQHGVTAVLRRVAEGAADAGVLLRPATVDQIAATAKRRDRMPPKTTYFHPKPRTGLVFRALDA